MLLLLDGGLTMWDMHRRTIEGAEVDRRMLGVGLPRREPPHLPAIDLLPHDVDALIAKTLMPTHKRSSFRLLKSTRSSKARWQAEAE